MGEMIVLTPNRLRNLFLSGLSLILRRERVWGLPPILMVEPTNICPLQCPLCPTGIGQMTRTRGMMPFPLFKQAIDEVDPVYVYLWNWGEPLLNPEIYDMIEYAHEKMVYTKLSTNAHFLDDRAADKLAESGLDYLIVSLDGASEKTYTRYRKEGDYGKVINNLISLVDRKPDSLHAALQFIIMKHNQHELDEIKTLAKNIGVDELLLKTASVDLIDYDTEEQRKKNLREYLPDTEHQRRIYQEHRKHTFCDRPWVSAVINWDGAVTPCCYDYDGRITLGNIRYAPFRQAWNSPAYRKLRQTIKKDRNMIPLCVKCPIGSGLTDFLNRFK